MKEDRFMGASQYCDLIRPIRPDQAVPSGYEGILFNERGKMVSSIGERFGRGTDRLIIQRGFHRSIGDAPQQLKKYLEQRLFFTREEVHFDLVLRVKRGKANAQEIAMAHWSEVLGPEELFYTFFANELRMLLEASALTEKLSVDGRIAKNREAWERDLTETLQQKFLFDYEIMFIVQKEVEFDDRIGTLEGQFLHVNFLDRIDKEYPLKIEMRLRSGSEGNGKSSISRDPEQLRRTLLDLIKRSCEQSIYLSDYWFDSSKLKDKLQADLDAHLADYGHHVSNLVAVPPQGGGNTAPARTEKLDAKVEWRDAQGYSVTFNAEATATIKETGAGLYDRLGQPKRADWFARAAEAALKHHLAGKSILDLTQDDIGPISDAVRQSMLIMADAKGLELSFSIGFVYLPNQKWMKTQRIKIPSRAYKTTHPDIPGDFSIDLEVQFTEGKALEAFFVTYREAHGSATALPSESVLDQFITDKLTEAAIEASELVMQHIDPSEYFTGFRTLQWDAPIPGLPDPGFDQSGENTITNKINEVLLNRYPGVALKAAHYHRVDRAVEGLRTLVGQLGTIEFSCEVQDRVLINAGFDRVVSGHVRINGGDAEQVVMMLASRFHLLTAEAFIAKIKKHLAITVEAALAGATQLELESLPSSVTEMGERWSGKLPGLLRDKVRSTLVKQFGLLSEPMELLVGLSGAEAVVRDGNKRTLMMPFQTLEATQNALLEEYTNLMRDRISIRGTGMDAIRERSVLSEEIERVKRELDELSASANASPHTTVFDHLHQTKQLLQGGTTALGKPALQLGKADNEGRADDAKDESM